MKILFWTDAFWPDIGGLEVFCAHLVRALGKRGHICEIITNREEDAGIEILPFEGAAVHGFPFQHLLNRGRLKSISQVHERCAGIVDQFQPDVIHLHGLARSLFFFMLQQKRKCPPAIVTLHDNLPERAPNTVLPQAFEKMAQIVAVSGHIHRQVLAFDPQLERHTHTILNALPDPEVPVAPLPSKQKILTAGRLERHKGFDLALHAFAGIAAQFPDVTLTVAGDGPERNSLQKIAEDSGFGLRIHFTGWLSPEKMPQLFNQHSVVIVPSRWQEPFELVALQAAQMGRPVIASRTGGLPEIVIDGVTGMLCESENSSAMTEALRQLLLDASQAARMGCAARAHASAFFKFDRLVDQYEEIYDRVRRSKD
jgi:glycogen(starch) synthase